MKQDKLKHYIKGLKHDVRSCRNIFTKYPFQLGRESNSSSFIFKADICQVQVVSSRSTSNSETFNCLNELLVYHWEVPGTLSEEKNSAEDKGKGITFI